MMDSFATAISISLQYGVPLKVLVDKFSHARYEPAGFTNNPDIPIAKSISDYIFRWLGKKFMSNDDKPALDPQTDNLLERQQAAKPAVVKETSKVSSNIERNEKAVFMAQADAPPCHECGSIMIRSGSCYKCMECGSTSGCS
jgi:ribonucleoside-diphosphate reductase alpha chain